MKNIDISKIDWTDKNQVLKAVEENGELLKFAKNFQNDQEVVLVAVKRSPSAVIYASIDLKNSLEFAKEVVKTNGLAIYYINDEFKNDRDVMLYAVKENGNALYYVDKKSQNNEMIVQEAVIQNGLSLKFASKRLRKNFDIVMFAVRNNGAALAYVHRSLKKNKDLVESAVENNAEAFYHASKKLQRDKTFVKQLVQINGLVLEYASKKIRKNKEIVLEAVKQNGNALRFASKRLQRDKELIFEAVKQNPEVLEYVEKNLSDKNYNLLIRDIIFIGNRPDILKYANRLTEKQYYDYIYASVSNNPDSLKTLSTFISEEEYKRIVFDFAIDFPEILGLEHVREKLCKDKEFFRELSKINGSALQYADESVQTDFNIVYDAILNNPEVLKLLEDKLSKKEITIGTYKTTLYDSLVHKLVKEMPEILTYVSEEYAKQKEAIIADIVMNPEALMYGIDYLEQETKGNAKDLKDCLLACVELNPECLGEIYELQKNKDYANIRDYAGEKDKRFALEAVKRNPKAINYIHKKFKKDDSILDEALKKDPTVLEDLSERSSSR